MCQLASVAFYATGAGACVNYGHICSPVLIVGDNSIEYADYTAIDMRAILVRLMIHQKTPACDVAVTHSSSSGTQYSRRTQLWWREGPYENGVGQTAFPKETSPCGENGG
jgi:hypothetical protein